MDKRAASLGARKKKLKKHSNRLGLLKKVVDYLMSDSHMYAPLVCRQSSNFPPPYALLTLPKGVETKEPSRGKEEKLLKKVGEYLKSDDYMYGRLIDPQPSHGFDSTTVIPQPGPVWHMKKVTTAFSTRATTKKSTPTTKSTKEVVAEDRGPDKYHFTRSTVVRQTLAHCEAVKQEVQNCRSSSIPGKGMLETETRKVM